MPDTRRAFVGYDNLGAPVVAVVLLEEDEVTEEEAYKALEAFRRVVSNGESEVLFEEMV